MYILGFSVYYGYSVIVDDRWFDFCIVALWTELHAVLFAEDKVIEVEFALETSEMGFHSDKHG